MLLNIKQLPLNLIDQWKNLVKNDTDTHEKIMVFTFCSHQVTDQCNGSISGWLDLVSWLWPLTRSYTTEVGPKISLFVKWTLTILNLCGNEKRYSAGK